MAAKLEIEASSANHQEQSIFCRPRSSPKRWSSNIIVALTAIPLAYISFWFFLQSSGSNNEDSFQLRTSANIPRRPPINVTFGDYLDVPPCAKAVVVALHRKDDTSDSSLPPARDEDVCQGLLIRDDLILTSSNCSQGTFIFDFPGVGFIRAVPRNVDNLNGTIIDSRLGFLEANPPAHYQFIDSPTRRNRMFLSLRASPGINGTDNGTAVAMSCSKHDRPIAHNFPVDGELVPVGYLHAVLPHVLWEHTDLNTAPELTDKDQRWWSRRVTFEDEKKVMQALFKKYEGPPGSIDIVSAHYFYLGQASATCEAEDPRGHRRDCFSIYYGRYQEEDPFSGESFFDWLDFGSGKDILERKKHGVTFVGTKNDDKFRKWCYKKRFNRKLVHYFTDAERRSHEVDIVPSDNGKDLMLQYKESGETVPKSDADVPHLYMWGLNETMYVVDDSWDHKQFGLIKHSGVIAAQPALSAGNIYIGDNGTIWGINYASGHYRPDIQAVAMMHQWMKNREFNVTALHWVGRKDWSTADCVATDWQSIKITGYDADTLNRSCYEVTVSPTWILKDDF